MVQKSAVQFAALVVTIAFGGMALVGCAPAESEQKGKYPDLSLAETKSPVQLLRNEAASRVPEDAIKEVVKTEDKSSNCMTAEADPKGLIRQWDSTVRIAINADNGADVQALVDALADSFVEQGWKKGTFGVASIIDLTSETSPVAIHVSAKKADPETNEGGAIQLTASGPCVETDGAESDEVIGLEARED